MPASETAILRMIRETSGDCYESARSLNQQLTFEKASGFFHKRGLEFGDAQKRTLGIIGEDGTYTNLGFFLSEQCMHTTKIAVFEGGTRNVFKDRIELSGSLLGQLEEAYSFIDRHNRTRAEFNGLDRIDMRDYPTEAIREALLNAIVHREYAFRDSTLISIFEDRIEFVTIGGLVKGMTFDDIMLGVSVLRNKRLADVFYQLRLIEAYGTGLMKINGCYAKSNVKPRILVTDNAFKIILPNMNSSEGTGALFSKSEEIKKVPAVLDKRESAVLRMLNEAEYVVRKDVQDALLVSQATAILLLREMTDKGLIVKEGSGKYLCYKLNETR